MKRQPGASSFGTTTCRPSSRPPASGRALQETRAERDAGGRECSSRRTSCGPPGSSPTTFAAISPACYRSGLVPLVASDIAVSGSVVLEARPRGRALPPRLELRLFLQAVRLAGPRQPGRPDGADGGRRRRGTSRRPTGRTWSYSPARALLRAMQAGPGGRPDAGGGHAHVAGDLRRPDRTFLAASSTSSRTSTPTASWRPPHAPRLSPSGALAEAFVGRHGHGARILLPAARGGPARGQLPAGGGELRRQPAGVGLGVRWPTPGLFGHPDHYSKKFTGTTEDERELLEYVNHAFSSRRANRTSALEARRGRGQPRAGIEKVFFRALVRDATFSGAGCNPVGARSLPGITSEAIESAR